MEQPLLVFRLYGRFHWPPVGPTAPPASQEPAVSPTKAGVVDIYFANQTPADPRLSAFLRWRTQAKAQAEEAAPGKGRLDIEGVPTESENVYRKTPVELAQYFDGEDVRLWIFDPARDHHNNEHGVKLTFSGAFLFNQFNIRRQFRELVLPLTRECRYETNGSQFYSQLLIGQSGNDNFRFDLQLPVPISQTNLNNPNALNPAVFSFSILYVPRNDRDQIASIDTLVVGRSGRLAYANYVQQNFEKIPLGQFGFSAFKTDETIGSFADFQRGQDAQNPRELRYFWPTKAGGLAEGVLKRLGFGTRPADSTHLALGPGDARDLSVRIETAGHDNPAANKADPTADNDNLKGVSRLIYRFAVKTNGGGNIGGEDGLSWNQSRFVLNLEKEVGGKLRIDSNTLNFDLVLSWAIEQENSWNSDKWNLRLAPRIHWQEEILAGPLGQQARADTEVPEDWRGAFRPEYFRRGALLNAAATVEDAQDALRNTEGAAPFSALPVLSLDDKAPVRFILASPEIPIALDVSGLIPEETSGERQALRLTLASGDDHALERFGLFAEESSAPIQARATFPAMLRYPLSGAHSSERLPISIKGDPQWMVADRDENAERFFASFLLAWEPHVPAPKSSWRLASLTFSAANLSQLPGKIAGYLRCGGPGIVLPATGAPVFARRETPTRPTALKFQMLFAVNGISPSNVDVARFDRGRRVDPLLIASGDPDGDQPFWFRVTEQITPTLDRALTADIYRSVQGVPGNLSYVLLSEEPFSVLRFKTASLASRSDEGSAAVAEYSSDDRLWKLKQVADRYHYVLPPQVVGESADKPRRLEIFDLPDVLPADDDGFRPFRPYDGAPGDGVNAQDWGDLHRRAIEFRLAPSTEIWLRPSDVQRSFYMAEWDADQLFRQRGELGLGAALGELRGEFLYGLSVGIDVSRERGVARQARVAELEALTGRVVGAPTNDTEHPLSREWNALGAAIARRPQRLEVWANDPDSPVPFAPARFADGVDFALRGTALLRAPVAGTVKPTVTGKEFEDPNRDLTRKPQGTRLRYHPQGLAGGAVWPVESGNLFRALCDNPDSVGGSIESIALSPIGGDASQTAKFLNGNVSIISETRNGFIERQRVEVIGRIGAHWHRAKHVVVYARTTSPTAQFAPRRSEDPNQRRSRRPILRKVSEYVELIEWERRYPDFPTASKQHAGFLERVRFNSRRINVDSAWSSDVGDYGWRIPLWNRASARERPQVYPMPDVAFVTTAEGEGDDQVVVQECLDPDRLYFFADFKAGTDDTNTWATRLAIDYVNLPSAATLAGIADARSARDPDLDGASRRPSVARVLPGASRFTWRLAPAARKTALNAGRASKPVYVGLNSVTFMRSTGQKDALVDGLADVLANSANVDPYAKDNNGKETYKAINDLEYWDRNGTGGPDGADNFKKALDKLCKADSASALTAAGELATQWNTIRGNLQTKLKPAADAAAKIDAGFDRAKDFVGATEKQCARLKADAISTLRGKSALVIENIRTWANDADALLRSFDKTTKKDLIDSLKEEIIVLVRPVFAETSADAGHVEADVEKARSIVSDVDAEVETVFDRARARVAAFSASYDRTKPWSKNRRETFQAGVYAAIDNISADIQGLIDEARQRFAVELGNTGQAIGGQLSKVLQTIAVGKVQAIAGLSDLNALVENLIKPHCFHRRSPSGPRRAAKGLRDKHQKGAGRRSGARPHVKEECAYRPRGRERFIQHRD